MKDDFKLKERMTIRMSKRQKHYLEELAEAIETNPSGAVRFLLNAAADNFEKQVPHTD